MRRTALILAIFGVITIAAGGAWLYVKRSRSQRLLTRCEVALQAGQFTKAANLAEEYIGTDPDDWNGYHLLAQARVRLGQHAEARDSLQKAKTIAPGVTTIRLLLADTYITPAERILDPLNRPNIPDTTSALEELEKAHSELLEIDPPGGLKGIVVLEAIGMNEQRISRGWYTLARLHQLEAQTSAAAGADDLHQQHTQQFDRALDKAQDIESRAFLTLLDCLRQLRKLPELRAKNPPHELVETLNSASRSLGVLSARHDDRSAVLQSTLEGIEDLVPVAATTVAMNNLARCRIHNPEAIPQSQQHTMELMDRLLDILPSDHPDINGVKLPRSELAMAVGDLALAQKLIEEVLADEPGNRKAQVLEGNLLLRQGQVMEAHRRLFLVKTQHPNWAEAQYAYAQAAQSAGKPAMAREAMQAVVALHPTHVHARQYLVDLYINEGLNDQAFEEAAGLYRHLNEPDPQALLLYVHAARHSGRDNLARMELQNATEHARHEPALAMAIAEGYAMLGDGEACVQATQEALRQTPDNPDAQLAAAKALLLAGRIDDAELILAIQVARHPDHAGLAFELGKVYHMTGRRLAAIEQYRTAMNIDPSSPAARMALARALFENGDLEYSKTLLETFDETDSGANVLRLQIKILQGEPVGVDHAILVAGASSDSVIDVAMAFFVNGEMDKCIEVCLAEAKRSPHDRHIRAMLGHAYAIAGKVDLCVEQWAHIISSDPTQLSNYLSLANVLAKTQSIEQVRKTIGQIPSRDPRMVELASAWLLTRSGDFAQAADIYQRVQAQMADAPDDRNHTSLMLAYCLAREGKHDLALNELDQLISHRDSAGRALEAKAQLLIMMDNSSAAMEAVSQLHALARDMRSAEYLERAAILYFRLDRLDLAIGICQELIQAMPNDDRPYIVQADLLTASARRQEAISLYQTAIALRPKRLSNHLALARLMDAQFMPMEALETLDNLKNMSRLARSIALFERASMLARWGLFELAIADLEDSSTVDNTRNAEIQLRLAQCHANLGRRDKAREYLRSIPPNAPQYAQAQQLVASLEEDPDKRLAVLESAMNHPAAGPALLSQRMGELMNARKHAHAADEFVAYRQSHAKDIALPTPVIIQAIEAFAVSGDITAARTLADEISISRNLGQWRTLSTLLQIAEDPRGAIAVVAKPHTADLANALCGICIGAMTGDENVSGKYLSRLTELENSFAQSTNEHVTVQIGIERVQIGQGPGGAIVIKQPIAVQSSYRILASLCAGDVPMAQSELARFKGSVGVPHEVALTLVNNFEGDRDRPNLARLLMATMATDLDAPGLARVLIGEMIDDHCIGPWSAALLMRISEDQSTCDNVLKSQHNPDGVLATLVKASQMKLAGRFEEAADLYRVAAEAEPQNYAIMLSHALSAETVGRYDEALDAYLRVHQAVSHPIAANNAAYLISLLHPDDHVKLNQARILANSAIAAAPGISHFRDTRGWIAYLLGDVDTARRELRMALRHAPASPEVHYHLALAESKGPNAQLAKWHLSAAVALEQRIVTGEHLPDRGAMRAIELARTALDEQLQ